MAEKLLGPTQDNENIQVEGNIYFFSDYYFNVDDVAKGYAPIRSFKSSGDTYGDLYGFHG